MPDIRERLTTLTDEQRKNARRVYNDRQADRMVEHQYERETRRQIVSLADALLVAIEHPRDPDCRRLLHAVLRATCAPLEPMDKP